jgi:transcriptional regulator of heat shock response
MLENEYSKVKVNNEMDLCSVTDPEAKAMVEKAFLKARVSYFLRWEKPSFFEKLFKDGKTKIVFCINSAQLSTAEEVLANLEDVEDKIKMLKIKSHNTVNI